MSASLMFPSCSLIGLGMGSQNWWFAGNLPFTLSLNFRSKIVKAAPHPDGIFKVPRPKPAKPGVNQT